jgi:hypothetical protein
MSTKVKSKLRKEFNRTYLARDFDSIRNHLIEQAAIYFPDKIRDFSEPSVGGLLVELAATVGDAMSFYMDHQFRELDPLLAVEPANIENHLRNAGVKIFHASPATVEADLAIKVPVEFVNDIPKPKKSSLPTMMQQSVFKSSNGVSFTLVDNINFAELDSTGEYVASYTVDTVDTNNVPLTMRMTRSVTLVSGQEVSESFNIADNHVPFRELTLANTNVTDILSVTDSDGENYYEVDSLSQDTVFTEVDNVSDDAALVRKNLEIIPATRRFVVFKSNITKTTTIRFGSGDASILDDDIVPDPSELSLPLYGKKTFSAFSIDPNSLLQTQTLGISPRNTTITVRYRYGGGLNHNVDANTVREVSTISLEFRNNPEPDEALFVRRNISINNPTAASGGQEAPDLQFLKGLIPSARNAQSRVVTKNDLLSRIYTLPAQFGRVFRASIADNPVNPMSLLVYVACLDLEGKLTVAPDALKLNLSKYLNEFRLISDAYDVLDARIINFGITYEVYLEKSANRTSTVQSINRRLSEALNQKYFQIDQPLIIDDIVNIIINSNGVIALSDLRVYPINGIVEDREYANTRFSFESSTKKGIIRGPVGSIFELKYSNNDIIGSAV